ncbi:uncharacterized protein FOMMEDRAFT_160307 [Fomitiporia mediterranea MF3/22]|uniref:uncharacterized protein n=1 Tax=Fomitiporia mediterranea (strain MF3/22) TaxID=694068 RepID=UPI000440810D|nr:uncharacterized protein FOMMEDRAFT_160307 [Fomitiporia mediterranea MF3/22]EJC99859.1 hypothetical protein FOMMEDRAFT_160307 [Fomitiporia mediterranea MF3/22]
MDQAALKAQGLKEHYCNKLKLLNCKQHTSLGLQMQNSAHNASPALQPKQESVSPAPEKSKYKGKEKEKPALRKKGKGKNARPSGISDTETSQLDNKLKEEAEIIEQKDTKGKASWDKENEKKLAEYICAPERWSKAQTSIKKYCQELLGSFNSYGSYKGLPVIRADGCPDIERPIEFSSGHSFEDIEADVEEDEKKHKKSDPAATFSKVVSEALKLAQERQEKMTELESEQFVYQKRKDERDEEYQRKRMQSEDRAAEIRMLCDLEDLHNSKLDGYCALHDSEDPVEKELAVDLQDELREIAQRIRELRQGGN